MLELGKRQELEIIKKVDFGVYLAENRQSEEKVLLPGKEVKEGAAIGDKIDVFLYKDSKDRLIATVREPLIHLGEVAKLTVKEVSGIGAFLDWGLEKDLFLPFKEQTKKVRQGEKCLAALYVDKSSRLCATMNVYEYLEQSSPYKKDDKVKGTVYLISADFGAFVAVDDRYSAMVLRQESARLRPGEEIEARVTGVKEDGKLDISVREKAYLQMDEDAENVMKVIEEYEGVLPFNDRVSPEIIMREFGLSKAAFKRAVGRLLKGGRIEITENRIKKLK